jgi:DNA-binding transcriptional regulator LsrR (DeoR family)
MREFPCHLIRVVNGNTIEADFDLSFGVVMRLNIRLFGVGNTNEAMYTLIRLLPSDFICETTYNKRGKVGRCLGQIFKIDDCNNRININEQLIEQGFALSTNT